MKTKAAEWAEWLERYGAEKFFESFMRSAQYAESTCTQCGEPIYLDIAEGGGVADWGTRGGDYGCAESPDTDEDGTGGHAARKKGN